MRFALLPLCALLATGSLCAQPAGLSPQAGTAAVTVQGSQMVVGTTNGPQGYSSLQWQRFSIPQGQSVHFAQPSANSLSIQRVVGVDGVIPRSLIEGTLSSNGRLALVNPSGILIGPQALVDTAGFTATTVGFTDAELMAGTLRARGAGALPVEVQGRIVARHGDVLLLGGDVRHSGRIEAVSAAVEGGRVVLQAQGEARVEGNIVAGREGGRVGGGIDVFGAQVMLGATAVLDGSGREGGGTLRVGGDYQGANPEVPNAQSSTIAAGARLLADATERGDGGRIIAWADGRMRGNGRFSARGGPNGGDGGFVEISGKRHLAFGAAVDTRAPQGRRGTLLLDPDEVWVVGDDFLPPTDEVAEAQCGYAGCISTLTASSLSDASEGAHLSILSASNNSRVRIMAPLQLASDLTLKAADAIALDQPITVTGALRLIAMGGVPDGGTFLPTRAATIEVRANLKASTISLETGNVDGSGIALGAATLEAAAGGIAIQSPRVTIDGPVTLKTAPAGISTLTGELALIGGGSLRLGDTTRVGRLDVEGPLTVASGTGLVFKVGTADNDQIRIIGDANAATFAAGSSVSLEAITNDRPVGGSTYTLVTGATGGSLPALATNLMGASLRFGSLLATLPVESAGGDPEAGTGASPGGASTSSTPTSSASSDSVDAAPSPTKRQLAETSTQATRRALQVAPVDDCP